MFWDDESALSDYSADDWDLWYEFRCFIDLWNSTYEEYWGINASEPPEHIEAALWEEVKRQASNAPRLAEIAAELRLGRQTSGRALDLKPLRSFFRDYSKSPVITHRIAIDLAGDAVRQLDGAQGRMTRLLSLFIVDAPTIRTQDYLRRAARLYVWGFEVESMILCRAVLESALAEVLVDPDDAAPNLGTLLKIAGRKRILPGYVADDRCKHGWRAERSSLLWQASRIRDMAGHALHEAPVFRQEEDDLRDAYSVLRSLMRILDKLFREREESGVE